jgi:hypothetical protein
MRMQGLAVGDRVTVRTLVGEESATVSGVVGPDFPTVYLAMDDGTTHAAAAATVQRVTS